VLPASDLSIQSSGLPRSTGRSAGRAYPPKPPECGVQIRPREPHSPRIQVCLENPSLSWARYSFVTDTETTVNRNETSFFGAYLGVDERHPRLNPYSPIACGPAVTPAAKISVIHKGGKFSLFLSEDSGQIVPTKGRGQPPLLDEKLAQTALLRGLLRTIWPRNRTIRSEPAVSEPAGLCGEGRAAGDAVLSPLAGTRSERASQVVGTEATWGSFGPSGGCQGWGRTRNPQESIEVIPGTHRYSRKLWIRPRHRDERKAESFAIRGFASPVENSAGPSQAIRQMRAA
jgi:hypothetical protein